MIDTIQYSYEDSGGSVTWDYNNVSSGCEISVELGPQRADGSPSPVTVTISSTSRVMDSDGVAWNDSQRTFDRPTRDALIVTMYSSTSTSDAKKIKVNAKPPGGLPGESPV